MDFTHVNLHKSNIFFQKIIRQKVVKKIKNDDKRLICTVKSCKTLQNNYNLKTVNSTNIVFFFLTGVLNIFKCNPPEKYHGEWFNQHTHQ